MPKKETGTPRQVDVKGRVAVPSEVMQALGLKRGDFVAFLIDGKRVEFCKVDWSVRRG